MLVKFVREPHRDQNDPTHQTHATTRLSPPLRRVIALLSVWSLVNFPDALLILRARSLGFSVTAVIGVYCLYNLSYALLSYPAGAFSDNFSRRIIVGIGLAVFAITYTGLGLVTNTAAVWALFAFYGIYAALTDGVTKAWIIDLAPSHSRGHALGVHQGSTGIAIIAAGTWAGFAWGNSGRTPLLIAGAVTAIVAAITLLTPIDRDSAKQSPTRR